MLDNLSKYHIILASNSPRRKELLQKLGLNFKVRTLCGIDESYPDNLSNEQVAIHIAENKAKAYVSCMADDELIITADTIVCVDGHILGKPHNVDAAKEMLKMLSNKTHQVITAVSVVTRQKMETFAVKSDVVFAELEHEEIDYYVDNFLPFDKAGGYGIQEWIGLVAVEELRGSFFNVMGLPIQRLFKVLKQF
jgi:septum formation protein